MGKILLLGASGFIGTNLLHSLINEENDIYVLDLKTDLLKIAFPQVTCIEGDFVNYNIKSLFSKHKFDIIFHLISTTLPMNGTENSIKELTDNVIPTIHLLDAMVEHGLEKIIFLSSGGTVYGESFEVKSEYSPLFPISSYGLQKNVIENYLRLFNHYHSLTPIIARVANPYGIGQNINKKQGIIPIFIKSIWEGKDITIWGDGKNVRNYIHIDDVVRALLMLRNYQGKEMIFNIASADSFSILEIIALIEKELHMKAKIIFEPKRLCDVQANKLDSRLITRELGWEAKISIDQSLPELVKLITNN